MEGARRQRPTTIRRKLPGTDSRGTKHTSRLNLAQESISLRLAAFPPSYAARANCNKIITAVSCPPNRCPAK